MKHTPLENRLIKLFDPVVVENGFRLVTVKILGTELMQTVQVTAENPKTRRLGVEDCTLISRELCALMDVEDPIKSAYRLEVSSPGIDRLLITFQDFVDFTGFEAKVELAPPQTGQKKFRGRITSTDENNGTFVLTMEDKGDVTITFAEVEKAKLVLTDDLIKATGKAVKTEEQDNNDSTTEEV